MKTFLLYGADAPHTEIARRLASELTRLGLHVDVDLLAKAPAEGWRAWNEARLAEADVVVLLLSEPFAKRIEAAAKGAGPRDARLAVKALASRVVVVVTPDDLAAELVPAAARERARHAYPSGLAGLAAELRGLPLGVAADGGPARANLTQQSAQSVPPPAQSAQSAPPSRRSLPPSARRTPSGERPAQTGGDTLRPSLLPPSAVDDGEAVNEGVHKYLQALCETYEKNRGRDTYVRPSGELAGKVVVDLMAHVRETVTRDERALVLLLGDYGTGKSFFAQSLAYELAQEAMSGRPEAPLPVYMSLSFARGKPSLLRAISMFMGRYDVRLSEKGLRRFLERGRPVVLVLDGLDELGERIKREETPKFVAALAELTAIRGVRVVLTCRTTFFKDSVDEDQIPATEKLVLRLFDDSQIERYLANAPAELHARMTAVLEKTPRLREMCRTPIHLLLSQEYVADRAEVGEGFRLIDFYDAFVKKNLATHATTNPGWSQKARRELVRRLGYHMFDEGLFEMSTEALERLLALELPAAGDIERVAASAQIVNASFFIRAGGAIRPLHFSFLEYFAAETLVDDLFRGRIERWNSRPLYAEIFDFMIQMIQRQGVERLPIDTMVASDREIAPSNFLATMYRWPVPEVRPSFEKLLLEGKWPLVRCVACQGTGMYDGDEVVPSLFASFDGEPNTVIRAVVQRLLQRVGDTVTSPELRAGIERRTALSIGLSPGDAEEVLGVKKGGFALTAYRKALMLGDRRPSSTIAAIYLLAGVADAESYPHIEAIGRASQLPAVRSAYEPARSIAPLAALDPV